MDRLERIRIVVITSLSIGLLAGAVFAETPAADLPTLNLEKGVYFKSSGGDPILVDPGEYVVDAAEQGIQLMPTTEEGTVIVIEAEKTAIEESLVLSMANANEDLQDLMVVMPDGIVYETVGSHTGIWPRGWASKLRQAQNRPRGKCPPYARCKGKPKGQTLLNFHQIKHLQATANTLCKPIKHNGRNHMCRRNVTSALKTARFWTPSK